MAIGAAALLLMGGAALAGYSGYSKAASDAGRAYAALLVDPAPAGGHFSEDRIAGLPEIAQRYFRHAIAPGTPLYSAVEIRMEGAFLLGGKDKAQTYRMSARQALRPPTQFVWIPELRSGAMTIEGSDALAGGEAWTRFWLHRLVPVVNQRTSADLVRSARFRAAVEGALWLPTSLLPEHGVEWEQVGPNIAEVRFARMGPEPIVLRLTLDEKGAVREVVGQRWSNVNPQKQFRLQPFGGTVTGEATFQGLTIPTGLEVGNHYGTGDYLPFFKARVSRARYH